MLASVQYTIKLTVKNPLSQQRKEGKWRFTSYAKFDKTVEENSLIRDSSVLNGFAVNFQVTTFSLIVPSIRNAGYQVTFRFTMAFPQDIVVGERIDIFAPVSYMLAQQGTNSCTNYLHIRGLLDRTIPECGGNMISWSLVDDRARQDEEIEFQLQTRNPSTTPNRGRIGNYFSIRVYNMATEVIIASKVKKGYNVIPSLLGLLVKTIKPIINTLSLPNNMHSCRYAVTK